MNAYKNALVTGCTGFVGSYFLPRLRRAAPDMAIYAGGRHAPASVAEMENVFHLPLDLSAAVTLDVTPDIIFHIAGEKKNPALMWETNFNGTRRLLDWAARNGVKRFVYLSSVGVYGARKNAGVVHAGSPRNPQNTYEKSKNSAEEYVGKFCTDAAIDYVILQPSNVIGIAGAAVYPLLGLMRMIKRGWFTYFGTADTNFNYVAVEDVAAALCEAMTAAAAGHTFIVNSGVPMRRAVDWMADEMGVCRPRRRLPASLGWGAGELASATTALTGRSMPFNRERFRELSNTTLYDGTAVSRTTGFIYEKGIEDAIRTLVRLYTQKGLL